MKCLKCDGELKSILKDGKSYAQCDKCGALFTAHDLRNYAQQQSSQRTQTPVEADEDEEYEEYSLGKIATISGWILCALFLLFGLASGGISLLMFLVAAVLISPVFRNRVYLSGKVWIPLVIVLFIAGMAMYPGTDSSSKQIAKKQEAPAPTPKQIKVSTEKQDKKDSEQEKAEKEEQERAAQEQAEREEQERLAQEQAEQERIAQEQAAAQAEQERIAQEQAEQERIAQEQAAAQAEQERIAQEQAAAQQAEQVRIAQEQAAEANAGQTPFNTYDNPVQQQTSSAYVLNTNTKKFHYPHCNDVKKIAPQNYSEFNGTRDDAINQGYSSCGHCNP